jgi:hypothetical protein
LSSRSRLFSARRPAAPGLALNLKHIQRARPPAQQIDFVHVLRMRRTRPHILPHDHCSLSLVEKPAARALPQLLFELSLTLHAPFEVPRASFPYLSSAAVTISTAISAIIRSRHPAKRPPHAHSHQQRQYVADRTGPVRDCTLPGPSPCRLRPIERQEDRGLMDGEDDFPRLSSANSHVPLVVYGHALT